MSALRWATIARHHLGELATAQKHADEVQRMLTVTETTRDRYVNAELHRLAAACYLTLGEPESAEASLNEAIETARAGSTHVRAEGCDRTRPPLVRPGREGEGERSPARSSHCSRRRRGDH